MFRLRDPAVDVLSAIFTCLPDFNLVLDLLARYTSLGGAVNLDVFLSLLQEFQDAGYSCCREIRRDDLFGIRIRSMLDRVKQCLPVLLVGEL